MPCPFTGPKMFCAGTKKQFYWMQIIFWSGTKCLWLAQYVNKFLVWQKKIGPAQNILVPVKGQGINLRRYFPFGPTANKRCQISVKTYSNFLLRRVIWHLFLVMGPKSYHLLRLSYLYEIWGIRKPKHQSLQRYFVNWYTYVTHKPPCE